MKRRPRNKIWLYFKECHTHEDTLICIEPDGKIYRLSHYLGNYGMPNVRTPCYGNYVNKFFVGTDGIGHWYKKFPSRRLAEKAMLEYNKSSFKVTYVGAI